MQIGIGNVGVWAIAAIVRDVNVHIAAQLPHIVHVDIAPVAGVVSVLA